MLRVIGDTGLRQMGVERESRHKSPTLTQKYFTVTIACKEIVFSNDITHVIQTTY